MSAFKDMVAADVHNVFLNIDEFADVHEINGERVKCIIDKDITGAARSDLEGVFLNTLTIYVDSCSMKHRPVEGQVLNVDDSMHFVQSVSDEEGMLVIVCEANEQ